MTPSTVTPTGTMSKHISVEVKVSAGAKAGTYKVTLPASLPDGETRPASTS